MKLKNKWQRFVIMVSYVSSNIHLHDTLHHTFAFINIHLDIHRIIIIITYTGRCFDYKDKASTKRKRSSFMLRCVRKEGKVFFAFGSKIKFRPQQSRSYTDKGEIYYKVCTNLHKVSLQLYYKDFSRIFCRKVFCSNC